MAPLDGVEGVGPLMEAPLQGHDHQDPLMEEGEVVVAVDSQRVMAVEEQPGVWPWTFADSIIWPSLSGTHFPTRSKPCMRWAAQSGSAHLTLRLRSIKLI